VLCSPLKCPQTASAELCGYARNVFLLLLLSFVWFLWTSSVISLLIFFSIFEGTHNESSCFILRFCSCFHVTSSEGVDLTPWFLIWGFSGVRVMKPFGLKQKFNMLLLRSYISPVGSKGKQWHPVYEQLKVINTFVTFDFLLIVVADSHFWNLNVPRVAQSV
jgi:hypothetical protein